MQLLLLNSLHEKEQLQRDVQL